MTKKPGPLLLVIILGSLVAFGPLSLDMYLPALPALTTEYDTTTSITQLSLTACLVGLALGQLMAGSYSDALGRRKPLLIGLSVYSAASFLCAVSPSVNMLIMLRFLQGMGGAAGIVIARAIVRDLYEGTEMTKFSAKLSLVNGAAPIAAPIFGALLLHVTSWRGVFIVLGAIGLIMLVAVLFQLPETITSERRSKGGLLHSVKTFGSILSDRSFLGFALAQGFIMAGMFAYISGSPYVIQELYGASPAIFSFIFAINSIGIITASQLTGRAAGRIPEAVLFRAGLIVAFAASILLLIATLFTAPLLVILIPLFFAVSSVGMVTTSGFTLAMHKYGRTAGSASALLGLLSFVLGGVLAPFSGIAGSSSAVPMGAVIAFAELAAVLCYLFLVYRSKPASPASPLADNSSNAN